MAYNASPSPSAFETFPYCCWSLTKWLQVTLDDFDQVPLLNKHRFSLSCSYSPCSYKRQDTPTFFGLCVTHLCTSVVGMRAGRDDIAMALHNKKGCGRPVGLISSSLLNLGPESALTLTTAYVYFWEKRSLWPEKLFPTSISSFTVFLFHPSPSHNHLWNYLFCITIGKDNHCTPGISGV